MIDKQSADSGTVVQRPTPSAQRLFLYVLVALVLFAAPASAQNTRAWSEPYKSGQDAIKSGKYQEAAQFLETAIKSNSKAEANKRTEGVFSTDYFPYYYLGIAYYELHQYDKAKENLDKAANPQPKDKNDIAKLKDYTARTLLALNNTPKPPVAPVINAAFTNALEKGDTALQAKRYQDALVAFDSARGADAAAYVQQGVQAKRDQAVRAWASDLNNEGHGLLVSSLSQAKDRFQRADQLVPGSAADGLSQVQQREAAYQTAKAGVEPDIAAKNFKAAKDKLDRAKAANPEQFTTDKLEARLTVVNAGLIAPVNSLGSKPLPINTPNNGAKDAPDNSAKIATPVPAPGVSKESLKTALLALVNGDAQNSISILEPISQQQTANAADAATLHAYLGVAYATRALSSAKSDERSSLSNRALEQFKLALSSQRDFKLSERIVSPNILAMFEQARH